MSERKESRVYELVAFPIKGVAASRVPEIARENRINMRYENDYEIARDAARDLSDAAGIRRVDIISIKTIVSRHMIGAYSMGVYMKDRHKDADFHHETTKKDPPLTRRDKKKKKRTRR